MSNDYSEPLIVSQSAARIWVEKAPAKTQLDLNLITRLPDDSFNENTIYIGDNSCYKVVGFDPVNSALNLELVWFQPRLDDTPSA